MDAKKAKEFLEKFRKDYASASSGFITTTTTATQASTQAQPKSTTSISTSSSSLPSSSILSAVTRTQAQLPVSSTVTSSSSSIVPSSTTTSSATSSSVPATVYQTSPNRFRNTKVTVDGFLYDLLDNLADGDCFFSAIYRAMQKYDPSNPNVLLNKLKNCNAKFITDKTEAEFIQSARNVLADGVIAGGLQDTYTYFKNLYDTEPETLEMISSNLQSYMQQIITDKINKRITNPNEDFYTLNEFNRLVSAQIKIMRTWVAEQEVDLFRTILEKCGIGLDWYTNSAVLPSRMPKIYNDKPLLNLYVISGLHWQHYVLKGTSQPVQLLRLKNSFSPVITRGGRKTKKYRLRKRKTKRLNKHHKGK